MRVIPWALALCLLAGCGTVTAGTPATPTSATTPPSTPGPDRALDFPESVLDLAEHDALLAWAEGDLNGDGLDDLAAVVERRPAEKLPDGAYAWDAPRTLRVLLRTEGGGYEPGQENHTLVGRDTEGGMMGEPFEGISIEKGSLRLDESGGSSSRWSIGYTFAWREDRLAVSAVEEMNMSTHTGNGTIEVYDFDAGTFRRWTYSERDGAEHRLLWEGPLVQAGWPLEDVPDDNGYRDAAALPPLPMLGDYDFYKDPVPLVRSAQEVLDQVKEKYYPDMTPVAYPWTEETRANYSDALGVAVPDCWYTDETTTLSYFWLDGSKQHTVMYEGPEDSKFYWIWDDTGEEWPPA